MKTHLKTHFSNRPGQLPALVILLLGFSILLAACGDSSTAGSGSGAATTTPIKLGFVGALSGTNAVLGKWATQGMEMAIDDANAKGGINGRKIELVKYDDEADPTKSVNVSQKITAEDKVVAAFATTNSSATLAVVPVFQKAKVVHFTNGLNLDITQKGSPYVFRSVPAGPAIESTLVDYLVQKKGFKKFAIITDTAAYGKGEADYQTEALKRNSAELLGKENYNPEDKDFTGQLNNLIKTNPEVLLFGGSEVASGLIAKQARSLGFKGQMAGGSALGTAKFIEVAGNDVAEGLIFTSNYISDEASDATKAFASRFKAKYNTDVDSHNVSAYDSTQLMLAAIQKAGTNLTGDEIARQLRANKDFSGLQGTFNFDEKGEGLSKAQLGIIKGGKLTPVS